jgi:hypothetical protein
VTDGDHAGLAFMQAINRQFPLADPIGAKRLNDQASWRTAPHARSCIDAFLTVYWAATGNPDEARKASQHISWDQLHDVAARATGWAMTVAAGDAGATTDAVAAAESGYLIPIRGYFVITDAHVGALLLAGRIREAQIEAERFSRRVADYSSQVFDPIHSAVSGRARLGAGDLQTACAMLESATMTFSAVWEPHGWGYRAQLPRTTALAVVGLTEQAVAALRNLEEKRHPAWGYLDYEYAIAHAWVLACQDAVGEAITTLLSAAETARVNGQFAAEVMCLQTATQFGDASSAPRLRELAAVVEGPRAGLAAKFAAALDAGDAARMAAVSYDFERMGDRIAAIDGAAHAAIAFDQQKLRDSALQCAARAQALADQCGAKTPALCRISSIGR